MRKGKRKTAPPMSGGHSTVGAVRPLRGLRAADRTSADFDQGEPRSERWMEEEDAGRRHWRLLRSGTAPSIWGDSVGRRSRTLPFPEQREGRGMWTGSVHSSRRTVVLFLLPFWNPHGVFLFLRRLTENTN